VSLASTGHTALASGSPSHMVARLPSQPVADFTCEGLQGQPSVADECDFRGHILVDVGRIQGGVDISFAPRQGNPEARGAEAAADGEDDVCVVEVILYGFRISAVGAPQIKRMVLRECALATQTGGDRGSRSSASSFSSAQAWA
jgi:hypothetical protein